MPDNLTLDFANALDSAVGPAHGLSAGDIKRGLPAVAAALQRIESERAAGKRRYRDLPSDREMLRQVETAVKRWRPGCENLVVLGIGGSALGNIALQTALAHPFYNLLPAGQTGRRASATGSVAHRSAGGGRGGVSGRSTSGTGAGRYATRSGPRLFVMDNVDPVQFAGLLDVIGPSLGKTCFNVISKSGETAETAAQFIIIRDLLLRKFGPKRLRERLIVTTDAKSGTMRDIVDAEGYESLPVPDGVGGRFTVLSAVGLFSAGMCDINIKQLLAGAAAMERRIASADAEKNPAATLALILHLFYTAGKRLHVMFPYSHQLRDFADWFRQLWAESLGKSTDLDGQPVAIGPTPIRALGATDQHSQVQLFREGPNDKVFIFLEVGKFDADVKIPAAPKNWSDTMTYLGGSSLGRLLSAEKTATEYALVASQRPCLTIRFPRVDAHAVGQFIMLWQAATSIAGLLLNINAYDQPAVQLGKDCTFALMGRKGYEKQARDIRARMKRNTAPRA